MAAQLTFRDVTLGYDRHPAVHHLSGEVAPGALLAVIGPNSSWLGVATAVVAGAATPGGPMVGFSIGQVALRAM